MRVCRLERSVPPDDDTPSAVAGIVIGVLAALVWAFYVGADDHGLKLSVLARPRVWMAGEVYVECRVPRVPQHHRVTWGIACPVFYRASDEQAGRVLYSSFITLPRGTCGTCEAFCEVSQHDRLGTLSAQPVTVLARGLSCEVEP